MITKYLILVVVLVLVVMLPHLTILHVNKSDDNGYKFLSILTVYYAYLVFIPSLVFCSTAKKCALFIATAIVLGFTFLIYSVIVLKKSNFASTKQRKLFLTNFGFTLGLYVVLFAFVINKFLFSVKITTNPTISTSSDWIEVSEDIQNLINNSHNFKELVKKWKNWGENVLNIKCSGDENNAEYTNLFNESYTHSEWPEMVDKILSLENLQRLQEKLVQTCLKNPCGNKLEKLENIITLRENAKNFS